MEALTLVIWLVLGVVACSGNEAHVDEFLEHNKVLKFNYRKKFRPAYHISAPIGWLNAPSGFVFYKKYYHIFFQYYPYNGVWGPMRWGHVISSNLIDWYYSAPALVPKEPYELHGCFAGSAIVHNDYLMLFYTGVKFLQNRNIRTQNVAVSLEGTFYEKHLHNPIIKSRQSENPQFQSDDARNPKVWKFRDMWYMILASTSIKTRQPQIILYTSKDLFTWVNNGTIVESLGDMGRLWEHPDFFEIDGQYVLLFTVHGLNPDGDRFKNAYQTGYVVGKFNYMNLKFEDVEVSSLTFNELDYGHDFYATQTVQAADGRRLLVGWLGMWQSDFDELRDGWAGMLTIIREVHVDRLGRILMSPLRELNQLRMELLESAYYVPGEAFQAGTKHFELLLNGTNMDHEIGIAFEWGGDKQFLIKYVPERGQVIIDRGGTDGVRKADWSPKKQVFWRIYVDASSIEVYCGEGEVVFSSRFYPRKGLVVRVDGEQQVHVLQFRLRRSVAYSEHLREHLRDLHELTLNNGQLGVPPNSERNCNKNH